MKCHINPDRVAALIVSNATSAFDHPDAVIAHAQRKTPEHAGERVADMVAGAEHVVFENSGHRPFVEESDRYLEVVREWVDGVVSGSPGAAHR